MRLAIYDELDRRWVAAATDDDLDHFARFTATVLEGMASDGHPLSPPPRYECVLREIEWRQLMAATVASGVTARQKRL